MNHELDNYKMDNHLINSLIIQLEAKIDQAFHAIPDLGTDDVGESLEAFIDAKQLKDRIDSLSKQAGAVVQQFADHHIPALLERHGLKAAPHRLGMVKMETRYSTTVHDRKGAHAWLCQHGMSNLIIETTNAATLSAVAKGLIEKGSDFPLDYFKTSVRTYAKFVPAGDK